MPNTLSKPNGTTSSTASTSKADDDKKPVELVPSFTPTLLERLGISSFHLLNKLIPWYKLPGFIGAFNLAFLRIELRQYNLHDAYSTPTAQGNSVTDPLPDQRYLGARHSDGKFNDLSQPRMGCTGMKFGRNFPREACGKPSEEELWTPNPREISNRFMARKEGKFIPATTLNLLAAAWIQFQTHDWFFHEQVCIPVRLSFLGWGLCRSCICCDLVQHRVFPVLVWLRLLPS